MKKKVEWQDVYKLPIHRDDLCFHYAYTNNNVMALTFLTDNEDFINKFIDVVNGNIESHAKKEWHNEGCEIWVDGKNMCLVRGWGYLTGCGALNLPIEEAVRIQDGFIKYIINRLNHIQ